MGGTHLLTVRIIVSLADRAFEGNKSTVHSALQPLNKGAIVSRERLISSDF